MNYYFDEDSQKLIINAKKEMMELRHPYVGSEHLLLAILHMKSLNITHMLEEYGIIYEDFRSKLIESVGVGSQENQWFLFTPLLKRILMNASLDSGDDIITPYHLLLSIFKEGDGVANRILISMNIDFHALYDKFLRHNTDFVSNNRKCLLEKLAINMNQKSINGDYNPVVGRDSQINQIIRILLRKNKSNPLLIGEAGVGKTALVEELAHLISIGKVPLKLKKATIYNLSMSNLVAGTKYRGEFEERFQQLIEEIKNDSNTILFIDEVHTLIGAGGAEGAIDASNILKPYLARGDLKIIGATTVSEYSKYIEKDKAIDRRFQKIYVEEVTSKELNDILHCLKPSYEKFHHVTISEEMISSIISFSSQYMLFGKQPDKAIDLLDEVCVYVESKSTNREKELNKYYTDIHLLEKRKNNFILQRDFKKARIIKQQEEKLRSKYDEILFSEDSNSSFNITLDDLKNVVYLKTHIPFDGFLNTSISFFKKKVIGQDKVIYEILNILSKSHYLNENSPLSFLFVGKKGVGKTFLAQELGKTLASENCCHLFHMEEFCEEQSIYKIIGLPSASSHSSFLNAIREHPFSILIFDEIDKAHPNVQSFLFHLLDDGILLDSSFEKHNLSKCIFIFTIDVKNYELGFSSESISSSIYHSLEEKVQHVCFFEDVTKSKIKKYIINYCKERSIDKDVYHSFIDNILSSYDYEKYGFSKLSCQIDQYLSNSLLKI